MASVPVCFSHPIMPGTTWATDAVLPLRPFPFCLFPVHRLAPSVPHVTHKCPRRDKAEQNIICYWSIIVIVAHFYHKVSITIPVGTGFHSTKICPFSRSVSSAALSPSSAFYAGVPVFLHQKREKWTRKWSETTTQPAKNGQVKDDVKSKSLVLSMWK